jgi:mycothiol synthase
VITFEWTDDLTAQAAGEVAALLETSASYDAEAGFSTAVPNGARRGTSRHHLLVRMPPRGQRGSAHLDRLPDVSVVAYLCVDVDVDDGIGEAAFVVRPEFRSLGVGTLLFERLRDEGGWDGARGLRTVRVWAHGAHPAADRMSARFGARLVDGLFKTRRLIGGSQVFVCAGEDWEPVPVDADLPSGSGLPIEHLATLAPADVAVLQRVRSAISDPDGVTVCFGANDQSPADAPACVVVPEPASLKRDVARNLLSHALLKLQDAGSRVVHLYVDSLDDELLAASRELEFEHDQSDLRYELDIPR